jgi:DNA adenine methylase
LGAARSSSISTTPDGWPTEMSSCSTTTPIHRLLPVLRREADAVIRMLDELGSEYRERGSAFFYEIRDHRFNPTRARLFAGGHDPVRGYTPELAAMLIFLNRTGYNGLFRLNSKGRFNVPEGRYERPRICDADNLRRASDALNASNVTLLHGHFDRVERLAGTSDFLYFDPPYAPVSMTSRFTSYTARQFGRVDQTRLHALVLELSRRGCHVVVSNLPPPKSESCIGRLRRVRLDFRPSASRLDERSIPRGLGEAR